MAATKQDTEQDVEIEDISLEDLGFENKLIVHNDHINTFDGVSEALIDICKHTREQAEQCAIIIHNKGRYSVKTGKMSLLKPMKDGMTDRGIGATIE